MDVMKMEKSYSKNITIILIVAIIVIVCTFSAVKVHNQHKQKLYDAMTSKIEEKALKCYNEDNCKESPITLKELYDKEYIETIINPLNDEYLNEQSYIEIINLNDAKLHIID